MTDPDAEHFNELVTSTYEELRFLARRVRSMPIGIGKETTSLVHDAYLRLVDKHIQFNDQGHFLRVAARAMRRLLVDRLRAATAQKRGGDRRRVPLDDQAGVEIDVGQIIDLDEALDRLAELDRRKCQVVELRFFAGLSLEETGKTLGVSTATAHREWELARAWVLDALERDAQGDGSPPQTR